MHSAVREASGIGFTGSAYAESFVLADVTMDWAPGPDEVSLTFGAAGLTVVAPLPGGHYRIVATVDDAPETPDLAFIQQMLDERAPGRAKVQRAGVVLAIPGAPPGRRPLPGRPAAAGRRRGARAQSGRRSGDEHRNPGRLRARSGLRHRPAGRLRGPAPPGRATGGRLRRPDDPDRHHAQPAVRGARNIVLPLLGHVPAFRTKLATELAELNYR